MKSKLGIYLVGCFLFSVGAKFFINSCLGVDPLDTLAIGLSSNLQIKIGTASASIAILFLGIWSIWNKRKPILTPFITMTSVGYLIDLWNYLVSKPEFIATFQSWGLMVSGLLICSYASSLIIMSGIGIRTMDLVAITITKKYNISFFLSKGIIEMFFIISGFMLSGPIGVGTIAFLFLVGPLIQPFIILNEKILKLVNYGMGEQVQII